jgi:uncharacterized protein YecT (DUF1311 family)
VLTTFPRRTRSASRLLALICLFVGAGTLPLAQAQSDDKAEKKPTLAEAKAAFAKADRALNEAWSAAKAAASGGTLGELTQKQREWLESRDYHAGFESTAVGQKDRKRSPVWHTTATNLTEMRAEWLRAWTETTKAPHETLTGLWIDSYGGTMHVVEQPGAVGESEEGGVGRLLFSIDVVRGPTYHMGSVAGVASWNERLGWWSDKGIHAGKTDEANLAFVDRDGCLEVIGAKTFHYHGARAYFDGIYVKVGPLDEKTQAEVIKAAESGQPLADDKGEDNADG